MKKFTRIVAALGLAAVFGATAVFAQAPAAMPAKVRVKGYTKTLKNGTMVHVKGYKRAMAPTMPKMAHVKGYTKMTKTGQMVHVKGYTRTVAPKKATSKPGGTM